MFFNINKRNEYIFIGLCFLSFFGVGITDKINSTNDLEDVNLIIL